MRKLLILPLIILLFNTVYWLDDSRVCEIQYTVINGAKYFSSILCTEDIKLTWVVADTVALKDVSARTINDFIIANNNKIISHVDGWWTCDELSSLKEIQWFETIIYSNNNISYTTTSSSIETLTKDIEKLKEDYNSPDLYNKVFDEVKAKFPVSSINFLREETRVKYFDRQLEIKTSILNKQKEKLTLIYKLTESQKFIEWFYNQINKVCLGYYNQKLWESSWEVKSLEIQKTAEEISKEREELISKYKAEFNTKLGETLDKMPRQTLQQLSVKLIDYAENSPIFKRFSEQQKEMVKLKITALKAAIDDRL